MSAKEVKKLLAEAAAAGFTVRDTKKGHLLQSPTGQFVKVGANPDVRGLKNAAADLRRALPEEVAPSQTRHQKKRAAGLHGLRR